MTGYIKLFRKFTEWEWYDDANTMRLFLHCLLKANWEDKMWKGVLIPRGSFVTGRVKLAKELKLTEMQVRTSLDKLKITSEITSKTTSQYSIITVVNWDCYQENNQQNIQQITSRITSRITTTKEYKNKRNILTINNKDNYSISNSSDFEKSQSPKRETTVFKKPTIEEIKQYCNENNKHVDPVAFWNFYESKNWMIGKNKMQKWKSAVCTWDRKNNNYSNVTQLHPEPPMYSSEIED